MIRMMTVLMITRSVTMDSVISVVNAITATMELMEPAVRVVRDTPLKRAVIVQVQILLLSDMDLGEPPPMTITTLDLCLRLI